MAASQPSQFALLNCFQIVFQQLEQALDQIQHSQTHSEAAKFRSLFEQSADALMLADQGAIVDCNQAAVELFGCSNKAELLVLHPAEISPQYQLDGRASFEKANEMMAIAQQNGNHRFEWLHRRRNGEEFWTEILLTQIELDGKPIQYTTIRDIRDRKQIEAKLREGEERFQAIFNQSFQLAGILSPDGILLEANQTSLDMIAVQPEAVIGKLFWETPWWTHSAELQQQLQQAIVQAKAGQVAAFEYGIPSLNDKVVMLDFSIKPITNSSGEVVMLIPEARDITDRKQIEAERLQAEGMLREQEQFLRIIYDNVEIPILVIDVLPDGNFRYSDWNFAAERVSGWSREEIVGKTPEEIFGEIEGAADRSRMAQCVHENQVITFEERFTLKGKLTWWITSHNPLCDREGRVYRIVSTSFNITDLKQAEAERLQAENVLREQEQFLRNIYDNVENFIFVVDVLPDGNFHYVDWNAAAERLSGLSSEEISGKTPEEVFGAIEGAGDRQRLGQCVQENRALTVEENLTFHQQSTWWITTYNPLCDRDGRVYRIVGTAFEITARKQTEEALQQSEARFQELATNLPGMIYQFREDADGFARFTYVSSGCFDLHEISAETLMQDVSVAMKMVHLEDVERFTRSIAASAQTLQGWQQEYRIITPSGKLKWLQGYSQPKRLANGDLVWDGFLTDVSDRKRAEAALEYQSTLLRTVIDSSPDWIFVKDCNFRYLLANEAIADAVGLSPEEIVGKDDLEIGLSLEEIFGNPEKGIVGFRVDDQKAIAGETIFNPGEPVTSADGSISWVETQKLPLRDRQGQIFGVLGVCRNITERKRAEAALRESEQNLRTIFNNVYSGFFIHDLDGTIFDVNQKVLEMYGITREQALKMSIADYGSAENPIDQVSEIFRKAIAGEVQQLEWKGKKQDGTLFDAEVVVQKLTLGDRPVILASVQDVSDRKKAEFALRQSQEMLQLVIDTLPQIIGWKDRNSIFMGCNKAIAKIAGFDSPADMVGKSDYEMPWTPEETACYLECDRRIMESGVPELHIIESQTQVDGTQVWLDTNKIPLRDSEGNVIGILFAIEDITDRKRLEDERAQTEAALRYSEQRFRDVTEAAGEYIWEIDAAGCYAFVSDRVKAVKGYEAAELLKHSPFEFMSVEDVDRVQAILQDAVSNRSSFKLEHRDVLPSGEIVWEEVSGIPFINHDGEIVGFRGTGLSITDRKRTEAALRQSEQNLRTIFNSVQNAFFLHEADGNIIDVNQKMLEMYGVPQEQALKLSIAKDYSSSNNPIEQLPVIWERVLAGETQRFEWLARKPIDGSTFHAEVVLQKLMLSDRPVILTSVLDITDRKQTEAALRQSEERLQLALAGSGDGLWDWDIVAGTTYFSSRWFTMLGYEVGELSSSYETWEMLLHPDDKSAVLNALQRHINSGAPYALEFRMHTKSGDWKWIGGYGKVVARDAAGQPLRMTGTHKDITDRKQTEAALIQSEIRWRTIFDESVDATIIHDSQGLFIDCNQAAVELFGYSNKAELLVLNPAAVSPEFQPDGQPSSTKAQAMIAIANQQGSYRLEWMLCRSNGEAFWADISLNIIYLDGKPMLYSVVRDISDRKLAEAELRKTQRQFQMLMDYAPAVIYIKDLEGQYLAVSRNFCELFQKRSEEILDHDDYQVHPPAIADQIRSNDRAVLASGSGLTLEETVMQATGEHSYISTKFAFKDEQGNPYALCGISFDISDRKQAEEALRQQQIQLQTILDAVPSGIWLKDTQNHVLRANAAAAAVVGLPADQIAGKTVCELFPQEAEAYYQDDLEVLHSGQPKLGIVEPQQTASGDRRWIRTDKVPYRNSIGEIVGLVAVATDITDRKQAEIALRESEQQLREQAQRERLLNQLTQQIRNSLDFDIALSTALTEIQSLLEVDRCLFVCYYPGVEEPYWEVTKEIHHADLPDLIGRYPASSAGAFPEQMLQLQTIEMTDAETADDPVWQQLMRSIGIRSLLGMPIQMPSGAIGAICCSHTHKPHNWQDDEIELLEAVMGQLAIALNQAELYAQSRAKAHELEQTLHQLQRTQAQMLQSEKMSSLGQLVAGVAHEINNPVNFIYGNLNYASDYIEDLLGLVKLYQQQYPEPVAAVEAQAEAIDLDFLIADLPKLLNSMRVGASRIQKIVASLRTFSRMDEAEVKSVNIHEGIDSTLLILQHRLKKRDDRIIIEAIKNYADLPLIECYAGQLNQVFMNLLSNAIDALEEALKTKLDLIPTITIQTCLIDQFVTIEIADNGLGIPAPIQQRLFDPFFTTKPLGKGTGMGLSISYQIVVEKHHGTIDCTSSEAGTTFTVKIPVRPSSYSD